MSDVEYRGVAVPAVLIPNLDQPEAFWWRTGVNSALASLKLWAVRQTGDGPSGAIVLAADADEARVLFQHHLESYEDCYQSTGEQEIEEIEVENGIVHAFLRPI